MLALRRLGLFPAVAIHTLFILMGQVSDFYLCRGWWCFRLRNFINYFYIPAAITIHFTKSNLTSSPTQVKPSLSLRDYVRYCLRDSSLQILILLVVLLPALWMRGTDAHSLRSCAGAYTDFSGSGVVWSSSSPQNELHLVGDQLATASAGVRVFCLVQLTNTIDGLPDGSLII